MERVPAPEPGGYPCALIHERRKGEHMQFEVDLHAGSFTAAGNLSEFAFLAAALGGAAWEPGSPPPVAPCVVAYYVRSYTQVRVTQDAVHGSFWACSCDDFRYRRQALDGLPACHNDACKHIVRAQEMHRDLALDRL